MQRISIEAIKAMQRPFNLHHEFLGDPKDDDTPQLSIEVVLEFNPSTPTPVPVGFVVLFGTTRRGWLAAYWGDDLDDCMAQFEALKAAVFKGWVPEPLCKGVVGDCENES